MNILILENIHKTHGKKVIFKGADAGIEDHDRIGVIGVNGTGKSTILSIVAGVTETDAGEVSMRNNLRISYLSQNPVFDLQKTVLENVIAAVEGKEEHWNTAGEARAVLLRLGIEDPDCAPGILSGGQRKRAALAAALLTPCDLLILDEPTNHLDIPTLQILEDYLDHFSGIVIVVSHDRYFLDRVVNRIFCFQADGTLRQSVGGYEEYLQHRQEWETEAGSPTAVVPDKKATERPRRTERPKTRLSYKEQKEYDTLEALIDELTEQSSLLEKQMEEAATSYSRLQELSRQKEETDARLDEKIERFLELQELVESFQKG